MDTQLYKLVQQKLHIGMEIKNYRAMCKLLKENVKRGNGKLCQLTKWNRYFDWRRDGHKYIVVQIHSKPLPKEDKRSLGNNRKEFKQFKIPIENEHKTGVYAITLNNDIYIGSTIDSFRRRFKQHRYKSNPLEHTYKLLKNGATFNALWIAKNGTTEKIIREEEGKYIEQYKNNPKWNVINTYEPNILKDKKTKTKYKNIKVKDLDYNKAIKLLKDNNIYIKNKGENKVKDKIIK